MPPPPSLHVAQFYEDDEFLVEFLVNFVQTGLQNNEAVIIIATAPHVRMLCHTLTSADLCNPRLSFFDTTTLLSELMVQDWPDHSAFMRLLGHPIQEACHRGRVRVYGEMVAVLWSTGRYQETRASKGYGTRCCQSNPLPPPACLPTHAVRVYPRRRPHNDAGCPPRTFSCVTQNPGSAVPSILTHHPLRIIRR
jgi:hypothetical protein